MRLKSKTRNMASTVTTTQEEPYERPANKVEHESYFGLIDEKLNKKHKGNTMNPTSENTFNEAQYANLKASLSAKDYEAFISFKKHEKDVDEYKRDKRKKKAGQELFIRKDALILRRVKAKKHENMYSTDDEALAYVDIHRLQKKKLEDSGNYVKGQTRIEVSDDEIRAFLELEKDGHLHSDITLEMIEAKVSPEEILDDNTAQRDKVESENVSAENDTVIEVTDYTVEETAGESACEEPSDDESST